jgi:Mg-chelatase subunit ChlD
MKIPQARYRFVHVALALFIASTFMPCALAKATGIDVVVVVDSSGSMKQSDPQTLRIPAAKLFFSLLGAEDSSALISFSTDANTLLDFTPLTSDAARSKLLRAADLITSNGMHTNLHAALARAHELLAKHPSSDKPRYIVLMSDGKMDSGDTQRDSALTTSLRDELLPALKKDAIQVHTIAFTDSSDADLLRTIARVTGGLAKLALTDAELHTVFSDMFERSKKPDMLPIENGEFLVDAAVDEVTIVASKEDAQVQIELQAPDESRISDHNKNPNTRWLTTPRFDMITLPQPKTGKWKILSSHGANKAYIVTQLKLASDFNNLEKAVNKNYVMHAWLAQNDTVISERAVLDATIIRVEISQPDGSTLRVEFRDDGKANDAAAHDGTYTAELVFKLNGPHELRLQAKSVTFDRTVSYPFDVLAPPLTAPPKPEKKPPIEQSPPVVAIAPEHETPHAPIAPAPKAEPDDTLNIWVLLGLFALFNIFIGTVVVLVILVKKKLRAKQVRKKSA